MTPHEQYALAATIDIAGVLAVLAAIVVYVVIRRRERAQDDAFWALPPTTLADVLPAEPAEPVAHVGATEEYGDQLAVNRMVLAELADVPIVDHTDTGAAILRVRRHVDDILVALIGDDPALLASVRAKANATGQWDGHGLWALLAAEDAEDELVGAAA